MTLDPDLYARFEPFTMVEEPLFNDNIALAREWADTPGAVVECGVWKGGMIAAIAAALGPKRRYVLCDSFQGLPAPTEQDGEAARRWAADIGAPGYRDNCRADARDARTAMQLAGAHNVHIVEGPLERTLSEIEIGRIGILRVDVDWHASTLTVLDALWDSVVDPWGLIILDDYFVWDGCARAVHEFLAKRSAMERIRSTVNEVAYIVRGR